MRWLWIVAAFEVCNLLAFSQDSLNIRRVGVIGRAEDVLTCLAVQGHYAYVGTQRDSVPEGLWVVDIADPAHPVSVAFDTVSNNWVALGIATSDSLAFIASGLGQTDIYDIHDPTAPEHLSTVGEGSGVVWDVAISGSYAFSARYSPRGVSVANVEDPRHPLIVGFAEIDDDLSDICIAGNYAYLAGALGLHILNISQPAMPIEVGTLIDVGAMRVAFLGEYIYQTVLGGSLSVINVATPHAPYLVTRVETRGYPDGIAAAADHIVVAAFDRGLLIYDVSNPAEPVETGRYLSPVRPRKVALQEGYAYVLSDRLLEVFDCSAALGVEDKFVLPPSSFSLSAYPNPFNPVTTISFSLPKASTAKLNIFDVTGRLLQTLIEERLTAGEHHLRFDGTALASGLYFARLETDGFRQTQKLMLVK